MHRTTIPLDKPVERELRRLAAQQRRSFKDMVNDLLKRGLKTYQEKKPKKSKFEWHTCSGEPRPFFDPSDRATYLDIISPKIK